MKQPSPFDFDAVVAISGSDLKQAALFFEKVIPLHTSGEVPSEVRFDQSDLINEEEWLTLVNESISISQTQLEMASEADIVERPIGEVRRDYLHNRLMGHYHKVLTKAGVRSVPLFHSIPEFEGSFSEGEEEAVEITLVRAPLIDTSDVEWDQIVDIRSDEDFKRKLRRFRLFINDNYQGKEQSYILDSLLQKMEDYETVCRKHGLTLTISILSKVLNSKSLLGALGLTATAILLGNPGVATVGALSGAAIEIGKVCLHIAEKNLELDATMRNSEVALLMDVKKAIDQFSAKDGV